MHGDEIVGRELLVKFLDELGKNYTSSTTVKNLVNTTEMFIMPSMNPDGSEKIQRANANNYDLNRNFPTVEGASNPSALQPETKLVMAFQSQHNFSLSANFHGGSVVVNYPWDYIYTRHPWDSFLQDLSVEYSRYNAPMFSSAEFNRGIVNGADWYIVNGGMQDWSYKFYNDLQVTVELSQKKYPNFDLIPSYWEDNKKSLFRYAQMSHQGLGFIWKKKIFTRFKGDKVVFTFTQKGGPSEQVVVTQKTEFFKVLPAGTYDVTASYGTKSLKLSNLEVTAQAENSVGAVTYKELNL
jgi:hypothetical protein